ncbi:MAG: DNA polymerase III subunit alpha [Geodermatophilaceae bacterium]|nr:DNA polymerase III subunit alpha [Geodermatophilaceae bacterium]
MGTRRQRPPEAIGRHLAVSSTARDGQFVHLHVHTEYSMLDGAAKLPALMAETARLSMPALAMTDHGNVFGAYDFYKQAVAVGVKPIIGMEGYYTPGSRFDRSPYDFGSAVVDEDGEGASSRGKAAYTHMTLLAESTEGMHNLFRLSSMASLEGLYRKPRFDRDLLERYGAGLIATTGCPSGEVNMWLRGGNVDRARAAAADFQDIFGRENFFCELMDHGLDIERRTRGDLLRIAAELRMPLLATNDLHYTHQKESTAHDALLCIQTGAKLSDTKRFRFNGDGYYLKSPAQMRELFREHPDACDNTLAVAERCEVGFTEGADLMPRFDVPAGESQESWFVKQVELGLHQRYPGGISAEVRQRADFEVTMIVRMGFPAYFLVVADFIRYAKDNGIRVGPGRGSATGSMIAYALGITALDPIADKLLFERFLNPDRVSMPDIDIDFDERRRGDVIRYVTEKYGEERVAQIVTFGTIKAKAAIKDAARVLDRPYALGDQLTKLMPPALMGKDMSLEGVFTPEHPRYKEAGEFRARYESDEDTKVVVGTARDLEGLKRQWGVHAAGVILGSKPLMDILPIMRREADGAIITQFDFATCEALGLLKMDFLGLRNLTILDDCVANIAANRDEHVDVDGLARTNAATYELLSRGDTLGVFQLDGGPMRQLLRAMRPTCFEDIAAVLALYRPGPMAAKAHIAYADRKNGRQPITPIHPELEELLADILAESYGLIVYQEQVMAIAQRVAGFTLGQADLFRRAMGKKKKAELEQQYEAFSAGMRERDLSESALKTLWEILLPFCDYGFNKSHTAGYGLVSYWTAYLKANYPSEYMAALLTSVGDDKDKMAIYLAECRRMGIKVLPPDVNDSAVDFTPTGTDIRFGLGAVRNVGRNVVASIARSRTDRGRFTDFSDFLRKAEQVACNKKVIESLIKAGAFDSLGQSRRGLTAIHIQAVDAVVGLKRQEAVGQFDLFGAGGGTDPVAELSFDLAIPPGEWDKRDLLGYERDMLGLYVSDHPLLGLEHVLAAHADCSIAALHAEGMEEGEQVTVAGILCNVVRKVTKAGAAWASARLEDLEGSIEVMVFPAAYAQVGIHIAEDAIVTVKGRLSLRDESPSLFVSDVMLPDLSVGPRGPVVVQLPAARCTPPVVDRLREVLGSHPGTTEVHLRLLNGARTTLLRLDDGLRVNATPALMGDLKALLGPKSIGA